MGQAMRVIVAGSRSIVNYELVKECIEKSRFSITELVSGMAAGVDSLAARWATENGVELKKFPADWNRFGKSAGYRRNQDMAEHADALILVWDGVSKGSKHMLDIAKSKGLEIEVNIINKARFIE